MNNHDEAILIWRTHVFPPLARERRNREKEKMTKQRIPDNNSQSSAETQRLIVCHLCGDTKHAMQTAAVAFESSLDSDSH
jgi:hypothetical protein